jgi:DNA-binding transcriptional LysR family regulator
VNRTEKNMDLSSLEIFCAVAKERSVNQAAQHAADVRSNDIAKVKQLEDELKVQLFLREGTRFALTPSGHQMLDYARRLLSLADEARRAMNPDHPSGRLRIGAMESTAAARLPALLASYHSQWPLVGLEISVATSAELVEDAAGGRIDCAFVGDPGLMGNTPFAARGLQATRAYSEHMLLVLPPHHPPARQPDDLKVRTLAAFSTGCTYRSALESWLGPLNEGERNWKVMEFDSYRSILACVAAGSCFAMCPKAILDLQCAPMDVRTQDFGTIDTYLVARTGFSSSAYDKLLRAIQAGTRFRSASRHMQLTLFGEKAT